jgi:hypothetical protein
MGKILIKNSPRNNKYDNAGVYKLNCTECEQYYIGQTGRNFKTRYKEHIRHIKIKRDSTGCAEHILNAGHSCVPMEDTMEIIKVINKGSTSDIIERYHT